ncbi:hypothetical protein BCR44DRAFT_1424094, partial [Catenaria anguillulae PL171]
MDPFSSSPTRPPVPSITRLQHWQLVCRPQQTGNGLESPPQHSHIITMADSKAQITIHIYEEADSQIDFRVKVSTKWSKVVKAYRTKRDLDESVDLRFVQRSTGNPLSMDPDVLVSDVVVWSTMRILMWPGRRRVVVSGRL